MQAEEWQFFDPGSSLAHRNYDLSLDIGGLPTAAATEIELVAKRVPDKQYHEMLQSLNQRQREFFTHVYHWIKTRDDPIHVLLSGGAGVGKSVVITTLYQALHRHLSSKEGEDPDDTRI